MAFGRRPNRSNAARQLPSCQELGSTVRERHPGTPLDASRCRAHPEFHELLGASS